MNSRLIKIGFWGVVDPRAWVDPFWDPGMQTLVGDYVARGSRVESYMGDSWCRFRCGVPDYEMGCADLSDGVYIWPEGFHHYIRKHAVHPPREFVRHVLAKVKR